MVSCGGAGTILGSAGILCHHIIDDLPGRHLSQRVEIDNFRGRDGQAVGLALEVEREHQQTRAKTKTHFENAVGFRKMVRLIAKKWPAKSIADETRYFSGPGKLVTNCTVKSGNESTISIL